MAVENSAAFGPSVEQQLSEQDNNIDVNDLMAQLHGEKVTETTIEQVPVIKETRRTHIWTYGGLKWIPVSRPKSETTDQPVESLVRDLNASPRFSLEEVSQKFARSPLMRTVLTIFLTHI